MAFQDTDLFLINRGGANYKISYADLVNKTGVQSTDLLMVQRGGSLYKIAYQDLGQGSPSIQTTDYFLTERSGTLYAKQVENAVITAPSIKLTFNTSAPTSNQALSFNYRGAQSVNGVPPQFRSGSGVVTYLAPGTGTLTLATDSVGSSAQLFGQFTWFNFNGSASLSTVQSANGTAADWVMIMPQPESDFGTNCYRNCKYLTAIDVHAPYKTMFRFLRDSAIFNMVGVDAINTSGISDFTECFENCGSFNQSLTGWDVSSAKVMSNMFEFASSFNRNINSWGPALGGVEYMDSMFANASTYDQPMDSWDVSGVQAGGLNSMFRGANNFSEDLTGWCVTNFATEPLNFSTASGLTAAQLPVWGTCP